MYVKICCRVHGVTYNTPSRVWRKSSRSANNGCCVEVAISAADIAVRDSKNPDQAILQFRPTTWSAFLADIKMGVFDAAITER
jgi:hypothetical protein